MGATGTADAPVRRPVRPLDGRTLDPSTVVAIARHGAPAGLTRRARARNAAARRLASDLLARGVPVYGRNTGVGGLLAAPVGEADAIDHDLGLLRSHACGSGALVEPAVARAMLVVRANQVGAGGAGLSPALVDAMLTALNAGGVPAVHEMGSIGTGDLTSLAEAGLALIGEGRWLGDAPPVPGAALAPGDAIALLSSNARTLGESALACHDAMVLLASAEATAALSHVAVGGNPDAYDPRVAGARPHPGQVAAAAHVRALVGGSALPSARLQDPLCFRCVAQVQGAARDALDELGRVLRIELNAAAENPLLVPADGAVLPNGNFHEARLALVLDQVRAALVQAGSQSAQRLSGLLDPQLSRLPAFLADPAGGPAASGAMILEYTAHAALDELRAAATPVTLANAALSHGVENHASFAALGARQLIRALGRYAAVVGAELVAAVRALRMGGSRPGTDAGATAFARAASALPDGTRDRPLAGDVDIAARLVASAPLG